MSITSLEILEQAEFPPAQARAIAKAIEVDFMQRAAPLATSVDLGAVRDELARLSSEVRAEFLEVRVEFSKIRSEFSAELSKVREEFSAELSKVREEFSAEIFKLRTEMVNLRAELHVEIHAVKSDLVRWLFAGLTAQTAALVAIVYFMLRAASLR